MTFTNGADISWTSLDSSNNRLLCLGLEGVGLPVKILFLLPVQKVFNVVFSSVNFLHW